MLQAKVSYNPFVMKLRQFFNETLKHLHMKCFHYFFILIEEDWRYRHAGLMAISAVAEGCKKQMEPLLKGIVDEILMLLTDQVSFYFSFSFFISVFSFLFSDATRLFIGYVEK